MDNLEHSAKGTSWKKKDHKYIKKIDGHYYYSTKRGLDAVEGGIASQQRDLDEAEKYNREARVARNKSDYWKNQSVKADKAADRAYNTPGMNKYYSYKRNQAKEARANQISYQDKVKKYAAEGRKYTERAAMNKKSTDLLLVSVQLRKKVDSIIAKFKK